MKNLYKTLVAGVIVTLALIACNREAEAPALDEDVAISSVVSFFAETKEPATKATLIPDETDRFFESQWEASDMIMLHAYGKYCLFDQSKNASWHKEEGERGYFFAEFDEPVPTEKGYWQYEAVYPSSESGDYVAFGPERYQNGNNYNSEYDIMFGEAQYDNALLGKDENGDPITIHMRRLTGIAYFHIIGGPDEEVVSATLRGTRIAADSVYVSRDGLRIDGWHEEWDEITILFDGTAPNASDFKLWFNLIPGEYSDLTLEIKTANKMTTIRTLDGKPITYTAGRLNKVFLDHLEWIEPKAGDPYEWTLSEGDLGGQGTWPYTSVCAGKPELTWNIEYLGGVKYGRFGWDDDKGVLIRSESDDPEYPDPVSLCLSTNEYVDPIKKIRINASGPSGFEIWGVAVGPHDLVCSDDHDYTAYDGGLVSGTVRFYLYAPEELYLKSIEINPVE